MARKTVDVAVLRMLVNARLASPTVSEDAKQALAFILEDVLHAAGQYRGYAYIDGWNGTETYRRQYH